MCKQPSANHDIVINR